jgi:hypothetical protein
MCRPPGEREHRESKLERGEREKPVAKKEGMPIKAIPSQQHYRMPSVIPYRLVLVGTPVGAGRVPMHGWMQIPVGPQQVTVLQAKPAGQSAVEVQGTEPSQA